MYTLKALLTYELHADLKKQTKNGVGREGLPIRFHSTQPQQLCCSSQEKTELPPAVTFTSNYWKRGRRTEASCMMHFMFCTPERSLASL